MVAAKQPKRNQCNQSGHNMRKFQPSLVDWDEIKQRVQAGEGYSSVAKDYAVSRQAITKRCNKEGWISDKPITTAVRRQLRKRNQMQPSATAQPVAVQPAEAIEAKPSATVAVRDDKKAAVLDLLADGVPKIHAAQAVGVHENTLTRWLNDDAEFGGKVRAAESAAVAVRVRRIGKAGEKDWRADSWYLERTQRATFGSDAGKGGGLAVQINIMRDGEPEVVDVTPAG
jgi:DNA invertase Pin-like site-specific DNA recombinase